MRSESLAPIGDNDGAGEDEGEVTVRAGLMEEEEVGVEVVGGAESPP